MKATHFSGPEAPCKICSGKAVLYGVVDFNKNCEETRGVFLPLAGVPVYYHACQSCGLIFTTAFDAWTPADFKEHIYNADYIKVDPDYVEARPRQTADMVFNFIKPGGPLRLLDYGGGGGLMAEVLRERGVDAASWDPMTKGALPDRRDFDVVTCFEVFEHTPTPRATAEDVLKLLAPKGVALFSTLTAENLPHREIHWYIAPRNGHITIYNRKALKTLFALFGYKIHHFNDNVHMAFKELPAWLAPSQTANSVV